MYENLKQAKLQKSVHFITLFRIYGLFRVLHLILIEVNRGNVKHAIMADFKRQKSSHFFHTL